MMKIGVVLSGGASRGIYELGVMQALQDYFGLSSIRCVSSASIGMLVAQTFGMGQTEAFIRLWKEQKPGRRFLSLSGNQAVLSQIDDLLASGEPLPYEHYVSVWNYTKHCVEYIPFHRLSGKRLGQYVRGAIAVPLFSGGEIIDGDRILDGAFLDNIPAYPLVGKDLDFVFCVYFDHCDYRFESSEFDRKVIKLWDFPNTRRLELFYFDPETFDRKLRYGYDYGLRVIKSLFEGREKRQVYDAIAELSRTRMCTNQPRLTADTVLNNINTVTRKYAKCLTNREKREHLNP